MCWAFYLFHMYLLPYITDIGIYIIYVHVCAVFHFKKPEPIHFITFLVTLFPTVLSLFTEDHKFVQSLCSSSFSGEINPSLALPIFSKSMERSTGESENCFKYDSHIKVGQSLVWLWRRVRKVKEVGISLTFICRLLLLKKWEMLMWNRLSLSQVMPRIFKWK